MRLLDSDILRFQELYLSKFGVELGLDDSRLKLQCLVAQVEMLVTNEDEDQCNGLDRTTTDF